LVKKSRTLRPRRGVENPGAFGLLEVHDEVVTVGEHVRPRDVVHLRRLDVNPAVRDGGTGMEKLL
jgi:hypothetical protein